MHNALPRHFYGSLPVVLPALGYNRCIDIIVVRIARLTSGVFLLPGPYVPPGPQWKVTSNHGIGKE
jgi:hypothetical protein